MHLPLQFGFEIVRGIILLHLLIGILLDGCRRNNNGVFYLLYLFYCVGSLLELYDHHYYDDDE
jgi:hypothetical protein